MLSEKINAALNGQVELEAFSSQDYLGMACWADEQGYNGISDFMYTHADEERQHMLKLVKFINERGGRAIIPAIRKPKRDYESISEMFREFLGHEMDVTEKINELVHLCLEEKDYTTHNFMQWFVSEQIEEERLARAVMDKLKIIGDEKSGLYLFDRDLENIRNEETLSN